MDVIFTTPDLLIEQDDFENCKVIQLSNPDYLELDKWLDGLVKEIPGAPVNILFPLMFGGLASDLLGLRLALHIRCSPSPFAHANLFIFGTESLYKIRGHEFSNIFATRGIELVEYNHDRLQRCIAADKTLMAAEDLPTELDKMRLAVPTNHYDSHSIANIWGMYRILELAELPSSSIASLTAGKSQLHDIYFKWLIAKNAVSKVVNEEVVEVKRQYAERLTGLKIMGKIKL